MTQHTAENEIPTAPWHFMQKTVWLLGLAILAWHGWWWPGILVLVAVSMIVKGMVRALAPPSSTETTVRPAVAAPPAPAPAPAAPAHPVDLLPDSCIRCGGPIHEGEVRWTGPRSAACSYCGMHLPLRDARRTS